MPDTDHDTTLNGLSAVESHDMAAAAPEPVETHAETPVVEEQPPAPPPDTDPPEPDYPRETDTAMDRELKDWLRRNIHWVIREMDIIKTGATEEERAALNP